VCGLASLLRLPLEEALARERPGPYNCTFCHRGARHTVNRRFGEVTQAYEGVLARQLLLRRQAERRRSRWRQRRRRRRIELRSKRDRGGQRARVTRDSWRRRRRLRRALSILLASGSWRRLLLAARARRRAGLLHCATAAWCLQASVRCRPRLKLEASSSPFHQRSWSLENNLGPENCRHDSWPEGLYAASNTPHHAAEGDDQTAGAVPAGGVARYRPR